MILYSTVFAPSYGAYFPKRALTSTRLWPMQGLAIYQVNRVRENFARESEYLRIRITPCISRQLCLSTGLLEKLMSREMVLNGDLRK
jgi:hypothetical protein